MCRTWAGSFRQTLRTGSGDRYGLSVSMNDHLALKVSLQWLYRNRPALVSVPLSGADGEDAGSVQVPLEKLDTKLTTAIVVSF